MSLKLKFTWLLVSLAFLWNPKLTAHSQSGFMARFEMTENGLAKAIDYSLENLLPFAEQILSGLEIPNSDLPPIGPEPKECTPEKLNSLSAGKAWELCWGLPEYLFKTWGQFFAGGFLDAHRPRPIDIHLSNLKIEKVKFGDYESDCEGNRCRIKVFIEHAKARVDLKITDRTSEEQSILFTGEKIQVRLRPNGQEPKDKIFIDLPFFINKSKPFKELLQVDQGAFKLHFPKGSLGVSFTDLKEVIHYSLGGVFSSADLQKYERFKNRFDSDLSYEWFMFVANTFNSYVSYHEGLLKGLGELLGLVIGDLAFPALNELMEVMVGNIDFRLPSVHVQSYLDNMTIAELKKDLESKIGRYNDFLQFEADKNFKTHCDEFEIILASIGNFLNGLQNSSLTEHVALVEKIYPKYKEVCRKAFSFSQKFDQSRSNLRKHQFIRNSCHDMDRRFLTIRKSIGINALLHSPRFNLTIDPVDTRHQESVFGVNLGSKTFPDLKRISDPRIGEKGFEYDFSMQMSIGFINQLMADFHERKDFDICLNYSKKLKNCSNGSQDLKVTLGSSPYFKWHEREHKLMLVVKDIASQIQFIPGSRHINFSTTETPSIHMMFDPQPTANGLLLNPQIDGSMQIKSQSFHRTIVNAIKAMTLIHPLVTELVIGTALEGSVENIMSKEIPISEISLDDFIIPRMIFESIESNPHFLKVYISLDRDRPKREIRETKN